jgi:hypothetical protein
VAKLAARDPRYEQAQLMAYHLGEAWRHLHLAFSIETPWAFWVLVIGFCAVPGFVIRGAREGADAFKKETGSAGL